MESWHGGGRRQGRVQLGGKTDRRHTLSLSFQYFHDKCTRRRASDMLGVVQAAVCGKRSRVVTRLLRLRDHVLACFAAPGLLFQTSISVWWRILSCAESSTYLLRSSSVSSFHLRQQQQQQQQQKKTKKNRMSIAAESGDHGTNERP
jgi:hypothetical protein